VSNADVVKGIYEAFSRGDVQTVLGAMDPGIEWREAESSPYMPSGEAWLGPDAVLNNLFVKLVSEWDAFAVHPKTFHEAGDTVIVEARYTGTHRETGKSLDAQVCHIWGVKGGKLITFQQYVDTARLQEVMGARLGA
jgi:ketosteroid isomerase-like protein